MTTSGKIRIYELSRDLNLDNKDVLDAAHKLSISAKSHSSSISEKEATELKKYLKSKDTKSNSSANSKDIKTKKNSNKQILSVKKAVSPTQPINHSKNQNNNKTAAALANKPSIKPKPAKNSSTSSTPTPNKSSSGVQKPNQVIHKTISEAKKPLAPKPRELKPPQSNEAIPGNSLEKKVDLNRKPQAIQTPQATSNLNKSNEESSAPKKPLSKPELIKRPLPQPPSAQTNKPRSSLPVQNRNENNQPRNISNPRQIVPQRHPSPLNKKTNSPNRPPGQKTPGQPPNKSNTLELFGAPIRRERPDNSKNQNQKNINLRSGSGPRAGTPSRPGSPNRPGMPNRPGSPNRAGMARKQGSQLRQGPPPRQGGPNRQENNRAGGPNNRTGAPRRPGIPSGMRKPVAPGELMQLQKPSGRPGAPPPRRPKNQQNNSSRKDGVEGSSTTANRPNAPSPKRPPQRQGAQRPGAPRPGAQRPGAPRPGAPRPGAPRPGAPRPGAQRPGAQRPGLARRNRPDWDDSAKLDALKNKASQKQRQKVHIIGDNDDGLTTETSGFAGEQQTTLLSASLARPAKPKSNQKTSGKSVAAIRKRKKETTRQRQRRRAMELRAAREAKQVRPEMIIVPEGNLTVQELADMLSLESSEIIKSLFFKGITATVTQSLDLPTIETVAEEFGVPVLQDDVEEAAKKTVEMIEDTDLKHLIRRPPVVTVMGHVDHGKTSLLDAIRQARVAAGEAGGITQHIGAYQVEMTHDGASRKLTFLDTPGHEAFTAMRARGTKVTDVAVLVVAADDGVRPQTLEAISHARAAEVPIVVAINKIDKEGASPDRVKQELSEQGLIAEDWGGDVVMSPVSAIKGENIDKLLEMILLVTEVEDLQANPERLAKGTVIEAHLDKAKGPVATLLVQNGSLKSGDVIAAGAVLGKVRAMVDEHGARLKIAGPSCPVEALGFNEVPTAGDEFEVYPDEKSARAVVGERATDARATRLAQQMATRRVSLSGMASQASEGDLKELNIILKADVQGSIEAILGSLEQLPKDEVQVRVLLSAPGEITETDVDLAAASGAVIVGFNTSMASGAKKAADASGVDVRDYEVIYKLLEDIQLAMEGLLEPEMVEEPLGEAEVRAVFSIGKNAVAGCYVTNGKLQRNCRVRVQRANQIVFEGDLGSLRRNKDDVKDVATGFECGVGCDRFSTWENNDLIKAFKLVTQKRKLNT